jgi:hypothetical protein
MDLQFPLGGVHRASAYQKQPPYTTPDALNVWPMDGILERRRGGSRPGMAKVSTTQLGSGDEVNLIAEHKDEIVAASNGSFYQDIAGTPSVLAGVTLASAPIALTAAYHLGELIICGDSGHGSSPRPVTYDGASTIAVLAATAGTMPTKVSNCCTYSDRIVFAEDADNPQEWYMSAQGGNTDFDYSVSGPGAAVSGTSAPAAGQMAEPITALSPWGDKCLVFGCESSLWVMKGDPGYGGTADCASHNVGPIYRTACCRSTMSNGSEGSFFFLSHDGLYYLPPGCGEKARSLSREKLPQELVNVDASTVHPVLIHNARYRGIEIWMTPLTGGTPTHWWFDFKDGGFWPMSCHANYDAFSGYAVRHSTSAYSMAYHGCRDGYIRRFAHNVAQDEPTTTFSSYVDYGPLKLAKHGFAEGAVTQISGAPATNSGDLDWAVRTGKTVEAAYAATAGDSGSWNTAGQNHVKPLHDSRGAAAFVKLTNGQTNADWAIEEMSIALKPMGRKAIL